MVQRLLLQLNAARADVLSAQESLAVKPTTRVRSRWLFRHWEKLWIVAILLIAALAHGINMFNYPLYLDDEGIYTYQAWAVVKEGLLDPYTYTYGHAPLGWIQIAIWTILTGGFHTFGAAINSGRVLMLIFMVGSVLMVYRIARSISQSIIVATIACLLFALSPYGIYLQRYVLLDNIMTFWMLLCILLLLVGRLSLTRVWLSAVALGISILSKEVTVVLVPLLMYLVAFRADKSHRWFATIGWLAIVSSIISIYVLMATLKGELFPAGTLLGGTQPHVSLIGAILGQTGRGPKHGSSVPFNFNGPFWQMASTWVQAEPLLVIGGSLFAFLSILMMRRQRVIGVLGIATFILWAFFWKFGFVLDFYLIPLIPLLSLNIALVLGVVTKKLNSFMKSYGFTGFLVSRSVQVIVAGLCLVGIGVSYFSPTLGLQRNPLRLWNTSQDAIAQREAVAWIRQNVPQCSSIIIDPYMWTDLHDLPNNGGAYKHADSYWLVALDSAIRNKVYHNDWRNIDYIAVTPGMLHDMYANNLTFVQEVYIHSTPIARFDTLRWPIEIRRVNNGKVNSGQRCSNPAVGSNGSSKANNLVQHPLG